MRAKVREIWKQQFPLIEKYLAPKRYFIGTDEVRALNRDESCLHEKLSAAAILGEDAVALRPDTCRQSQGAGAGVVGYVRSQSQLGEAVLLCRRLSSDTWNYLPKDMGIMCWYFEKRKESLDFFSSHGFKTFAAAYYDADTLGRNQENAEGWMDAMDTTPGATGIMYTTWDRKYKLLAPFGDLVSKRPLIATYYRERFQAIA
jgi:hypothetical protein